MKPNHFFKDEHWIWVIFLVPFLIASHLLDNLNTTILTFHWTDEADFHFPAILKMAKEWPDISLKDYSSATTPFFHIIFSFANRFLGLDLQGLRFLNVLASYLSAIVLYKTLRDNLKLNTISASLSTLTFLLSPYFFGASFILLTDNLAWLFCLLTIRQLLIAEESNDLRHWVLACVYISCSVLTRQSLVWLAMVGFVLCSLNSKDLTQWGKKVLALGVAILPFLALAVTWHGLVPPSFQQAHEARNLFNVRALGFSLAIIGVYAPLMRPTFFLQTLNRENRATFFGIAVGLLYLASFPMGALPSDDGFIWRASRSTIAFHGTSALFWILIPMGCLSLANLWQHGKRDLGFICLLSFILVTATSNLLYQKYFDPFIPIFILLTIRPGHFLHKMEYISMSGMCVGYVLYAWLPYR